MTPTTEETITDILAVIIFYGGIGAVISAVIYGIIACL